MDKLRKHCLLRHKALEKAAQLISVYSNEILCFALKKCIKNIMSKHIGILLI